jgi:hypothetical protein
MNAGHWAAVAWELGAATFIVLVILTVRKARARGKRLFADEPAARVDALKHDTTHQYEQDAL